MPFPVEVVEDRQREALPVQCRGERIKPPGRIARIISAASPRCALCAPRWCLSERGISVVAVSTQGRREC